MNQANIIDPDVLAYLDLHSLSMDNILIASSISKGLTLVALAVIYT
jgi:hypothetical protein